MLRRNNDARNKNAEREMFPAVTEVERREEAAEISSERMHQRHVRGGRIPCAH